MYFYRFLLRKILEILQYFQYIKIYKAMDSVGIGLFYRICVFVANNNYEIVNPGDFA